MVGGGGRVGGRRELRGKTYLELKIDSIREN